ncbi:unnamed protein product [Allacma fusca]|uniref:SCP domain-containing protein n=1 Tax=Allacma fusca TaxID=39272 RepID=A0A8J2K8Q4_9HEXA|nr:unnamed protein product [Allacma fusca]
MAWKLAIVIIAVLSALQHFVAADFEPFKRAIFEEHNKLRALHQAPPLEFNSELSESAQVEAERYLKQLLKHFKRKQKFYPKSGNPDDQSYNDNTWASLACSESTLNVNWVLTKWMEEEKAYNWTNNYFDKNTGHFTQMIWKSTEDLGIGVAVATGLGYKFKYGTVVVLRYSPPGNVLDPDAFASNVLPPIHPLPDRPDSDSDSDEY